MAGSGCSMPGSSQLNLFIDCKGVWQQSRKSGFLEVVEEESDWLCEQCR